MGGKAEGFKKLDPVCDPDLGNPLVVTGLIKLTHLVIFSGDYPAITT